MTEVKNIGSEPCASGGELVAYLYDELGPAERGTFESHLSGCSACTDEFAELSFARLDVYEWNRDEFAKIPTPRIVIPYGEAAKVSWFDHVRAMIGQYQWAAGGAFAAVTFAFAAYFLLLPAVSKEQAYVPSVPPSIEIASQPVQAERKPVEHSITPVKETGKRAPSSPQMEKANISVSKNPRPATIPAQPLVASTRPKTSQPAVVKRSKAPRLNDFEDEDDNTLRLGDLMADIGARKE